MKRVFISMLTLVLALVVAGCSAKVTEESLMNHDWLATTTTSDGVTMGMKLHFTEESVTVQPEIVAVDMTKVPADHKTLGESFYRDTQEERCQALTSVGSYELKEGMIHFDVATSAEFEELVKQSLPKEGTITIEKGKLVIAGQERLVFEKMADK